MAKKKEPVAKDASIALADIELLNEMKNRYLVENHSERDYNDCGKIKNLLNAAITHIGKISPQ